MRLIGDFWHKIELPYIYSLANSKIPIRFRMVDDELGSIRFWSFTKRPVKRSEVKFGGNFFHALYHTMFCRLGEKMDVHKFAPCKYVNAEEY